MNVNENIENEHVAIFLKEVAIISRISYNEGKKLFKIMTDKYLLLKGNKILSDDENNQREFSSWIKNFEKENKEKGYKNIINLGHTFEKHENEFYKQFFFKLFYDLTIMYFHCNISFPLIEITLLFYLH